MDYLHGHDVPKGPLLLPSNPLEIHKAFLSGSPCGLGGGGWFYSKPVYTGRTWGPESEVIAHVKPSSRKLVWVPANISLIAMFRSTRFHHLLSLT